MARITARRDVRISGKKNKAIASIKVPTPPTMAPSTEPTPVIQFIKVKRSNPIHQEPNTAKIEQTNDGRKRNIVQPPKKQRVNVNNSISNILNIYERYTAINYNFVEELIPKTTTHKQSKVVYQSTYYQYRHTG